MEKVYFFPTIDYRAHPAFRDLDVPLRQDEDETEALVDEIDSGLALLHAERHSDGGVIQAAFASGPERPIERLRDRLRDTLPSERLKRRVDRAFDDVKGELLAEAAIVNSRHSFPRNLDRESERAVYDNLNRDGAHVFRVDPKVIKRLRTLTARQQDALRNRAKANPDGRCVENFSRYSDVGMAIDREFSRQGVLEGLSAYVGSNTVFAGFALEYSHERQTWWRGCYDDVGLPDSRTVYMHYDHGCQNPKATLAISDVEEDTGPTSFISGSHREQRSNFVHFMVKSLEQRFYDDYKNEKQATYYRRMFAEVEHRCDFLRLPRTLQSCTHFGEDILDDSPLSERLLEREVRLTKEVGNCVVFDGDYGIHRGSTVRRGERFSFQIIFSIEDRRSAMYTLNHRARFLVKRAFGMVR